MNSASVLSSMPKWLQLGGDLGDQGEVLQVLEIFETFHGFLFERGGRVS